jgi:hypothetical protein
VDGRDSRDAPRRRGGCGDRAAGGTVLGFGPCPPCADVDADAEPWLGARAGQAQGHSLAIAAASPTGGDDDARECGAEEGMSGDPRRRALFASVRV